MYDANDFTKPKASIHGFSQKELNTIELEMYLVDDITSHVFMVPNQT